MPDLEPHIQLSPDTQAAMQRLGYSVPPAMPNPFHALERSRRPAPEQFRLTLSLSPAEMDRLRALFQPGESATAAVRRLVLQQVER